MKSYIGTKQINAKPMTRQEYNDFRGWELPDDEDGTDAGYLVEYLDGSKANTDEYKGYVSWSPKDVFEATYQDIQKGVTYSHAIALVKKGKKVASCNWNGKHMWIGLVGSAPTITFFSQSHNPQSSKHSPYIAIKTVDNKVVPWVASQVDMLDDSNWVVVE